MAKYTFDQVKRNVAEIANRDHYTEDFIFELMAAYGRSASAISQLKAGTINKAEEPGVLLQKDVIHFKVFPTGSNLEEEVEKMDFDPLSGRYNPRYIIATDLNEIVAKDAIKHTTLDIAIKDIDNEVAFFYGWTGNEMSDGKADESIADRRAADKMKDLYDEIERENINDFQKDPVNFRHDLNVFFSRLLFCFFAEDTGLFNKRQFTDAIKDYTESDGSDLHLFFKDLFASLDSEDKTGMTTPFSEFPYVNGTLFNTTEHNILIPSFSPAARHLLILCADLDWSGVNPDIFGTIFQGIVDETRRDENGMDYTSVPNIMKVIKPLFLDELHDEYDKSYDSPARLFRLWDRISKIKVFDPACGSGNFLIISYKRLRELEHDIIRRLNDLGALGGNLGGVSGYKLSTRLKLDNFYGIELEDFPKELAVLSMYIAAHQMNIEFEKEFGKKLNILPLIKLDTIHCGNSARLDWNDICPNNPHKYTQKKVQNTGFFTLDQSQLDGSDVLAPTEDDVWYDEIYVIGNPPYKGTRNQTIDQKKDKSIVLEGIVGEKNLDYVAIWFKKAHDYIKKSNTKSCFVSTNSITQGDQVHVLWPHILRDNIEIGFAYTSFKWTNNAKDQAGVTVVIISLQNHDNKKKRLFSDDIIEECDCINGFLISMKPIYIERSNKSISGLPEMSYGNHTGGSKDLFLSPEERSEILSEYPNASKFIRPAKGSAEYIRGIERYCLWITNADLEEANNIPPIHNRIELIRKDRAESSEPGKQKLASRPHQFRDLKTAHKSEIIVPIVSSERREYFVCGILDSDVIIPNSAQAIYDPETYVFAILESKIHTAWIKTVCGKLETRYRYSSTLGYNTFPCPPLTIQQKEKLNASARNILLARANHPELTLADMYDPDKMPEDLRRAHDENDILVDKLYRSTPFQNDEARLSVLFRMYEQMTQDEK